ncbi:MAG TPA: ABC-ATPase domain-containing protein, partial [Longimicrobiales bacterium]|nr:ABC-ATPase domain-containing protein [Longimicrobiales bacterium]
KDLDRSLRELDGKGYPAYKKVKGAYQGPGLTLHIDHVQGDPFAEPSRLRAVLEPDDAGLPEWAYATPDRRRATADYINRHLSLALQEASGAAGSGKSGELRVLRPAQEVLGRTALQVSDRGGVEARFRAGFPAKGRRILGDAAADLLTSSLIRALEASLFARALDQQALRQHVETVEDAVALRGQLAARGLVAFVADEARLPRRSGVDDRPLEGHAVVPFRAPAPLRVTLETPNAGSVTGMGVPEGVTLIVGGGYHGKSTLLRALERGVYDHIPGDGRERVVARADAVKVRAEDGRRVAGTDISNFIGALPGGGDTTRFETLNASGSTSQAAAIVEALEVGTSCLLLDEDTSATNFMIRDARMQALIAAEHEPITPFIDRASQLHRDLGVSTVVVEGGSGDYFDIADTVVAMRSYVPDEVTQRAREVAREQPTRRNREGGDWTPLRPRRVQHDSIRPGRGRRDVHIRVRSVDRVEFGTEHVDLGSMEQVVELAQTRAMAYALERARRTAFRGEHSLQEALTSVMTEIQERGLEVVHPHLIGELSSFRIQELAAFLGRLRTLETVAHEGES